MKKKPIMTVKEATIKAFEMMLSEFYLNQITGVVRKILYPNRPAETSISTAMRQLNASGQINYHANQVGLYSKLL